MNGIQSAFYDILTGMLIFGNMIFMAFTLFYYKSLWLFLLSLLLMFIFVTLRKAYNKKWEREYGDFMDANTKQEVKKDEFN